MQKGRMDMRRIVVSEFVTLDGVMERRADARLPA
jgi:hypothetical protein